MIKTKAAAFGVMVLAVALIVALSGCQKNTQSTAGTNNPQKMQQQIKTGMQSLVSDGTLTQAQADKVEAALESMEKRIANRPSGGRSGSWNGSRPSFAGGSGGMRRFSPLASLVSDGTITQSQADTVMQRIFGTAFGGQNRQGNGTAQQAG